MVPGTSIVFFHRKFERLLVSRQGCNLVMTYKLARLSLLEQSLKFSNIQYSGFLAPLSIQGRTCGFWPSSSEPQSSVNPAKPMRLSLVAGRTIEVRVLVLFGLNSRPQQVSQHGVGVKQVIHLSSFPFTDCATSASAPNVVASASHQVVDG